MSLFDGALDDIQKKGKSRVKPTTRIPEESFVGNPSYGAGTRSYNRSLARDALKRESRRVTEAYERGEMTFEPLELLCYCGEGIESGIGHPAHTDELEQFNHDAAKSVRRRTKLQTKVQHIRGDGNGNLKPLPNSRIPIPTDDSRRNRTRISCTMQPGHKKPKKRK